MIITNKVHIANEDVTGSHGDVPPMLRSGGGKRRRSSQPLQSAGARISFEEKPLTSQDFR
jgi:hypothetical protein